MKDRELKLIIERMLAELPPLVPLRPAAKFLGIHERTARRWIDSGRMRAFRTWKGRGGRIRIAREELARVLLNMA